MTQSVTASQQEVMRRLANHGNMLHALGLYQCAANLHPNRQITKAEFREIIKLNYMRTELDDHLTAEIDRVWIDAERLLDDICVLKSYSAEMLELYPAKTPLPDADYRDEKDRRRLMEMRKKIEHLRDHITYLEHELPRAQQELTQLQAECNRLGHMPDFAIRTKCRICGENIK